MKYVLSAISLVLLIAVIAGAAFYFGQKSAPISTSVSPTPVSTQTTLPTSVQNTPVTSSTPAITMQNLSGGGILVFKAYTLTAPADWANQHETGQNSDILTLSKNGYKITVSQVAGDGGGCTYPGQPPAEMAQTFSSFVEITDSNGYIFRRGPTQPNAWTVCQKNTSDGSFGFPTTFGNITINTPANPTDTMVAEIDGIIASLKQK